MVGTGADLLIGLDLEMKLITAAIYTNFTTHMIDDEGIEQADAYTAGPRSGRLILGFKRVGE